MLSRRYGRFAGGIDLPDEKHATIDLAIEPHALEEPLRVPLRPCGSRAALPIVEPGQSVRAGQKIAEAAGGRGVDIFSPISGQVAGLTTAEIATGDAFTPCPAIKISPDGEAQAFELTQAEAVFDWRPAGSTEVRRRIKAGGLTTYRRPVKALSQWIEAARAKGCGVLIANVMESEPFVTADHCLLAERGPEVTAGLAILARAIEAEEVILAVDSRRTGDYQRIIEPAKTYGISRIALPRKYPTGVDPLLVKVLTRREMPPGGSVMDVAAAVTDAATCLAVYRWVACGVHPTGRVVTVSGPRAQKPRNCWVPFGVRCGSLVGQAEQPVIHNGPMTGLRCGEASVVGPATDAVLALAASVPQVPSPCIRCSWCTDHCPARLNVAALNDAFELGNVARAGKLVAPACVECGVCTYVCPARLPLSQRVKQLKRAICSIERAMPLFATR